MKRAYWGGILFGVNVMITTEENIADDFWGKKEVFMDWGMQNRLGRLIKEDGHCFFLPIDHGYFQGPTSKLEKPGRTIKPLIAYADGLFVTRGVLRAAVDPKNCPPIILRVSGGTSIIGKDLAHEADYHFRGRGNPAECGGGGNVRLRGYRLRI